MAGYERPVNEEYEFPTVAHDGEYLASIAEFAVAVLSAGRDTLPDAAKDTVLAIEEQCLGAIADAPKSKIAEHALRHVIQISAMRHFGLLESKDASS